MRHIRVRIGAMALVGILVFCFETSAQQSVGTVQGTVKDPSGGVIIGARVSVRHEATGTETLVLTNDLGSYTLQNLNVGLYGLSVSYQGFQTVKRSGVRVIAGIVLIQDIELPIGEASQISTVEAQIDLVDTTSTTIGNTRTLEEITDLPLQMQGQYRNTNSFVVNLPGFNLRPSNATTSTGGGVEDIGRGSHLGAGSGATNNFVGYYIDGVSAASALVRPAEDDGQLLPEAVEEFRYSTNFNAEGGGHSGTGLTLVTKSGTNQLHGTIFNYLRNDAIDARNFFDLTGKPSPNKQNEYGFVLGGPIAKNTLFFFGSWDGFKYRRAAGGTTGTVPTDRMRAGDFSEWLGAQIGTDALGRPVFRGQIFDPQTNRSDGRGGFIRDPFPGNIIPTSRISSISKFFQDAGYPRANRPGTQNNWSGTSIPRATDADRINLKVDNNAWGNHRLSIGTDFLLQKKQAGETLTPVTWTIGNSNRNDVQYRGRIVDNWAPRPDLLVSFRGAFNRYKYMDVSPEPTASFGCKAGLTGTAACGTPATNIEATAGLGWMWNNYFRFFTHIPVDADVSWNKGKHNLKFGTGFIQHVTALAFTLNSAGTFNFNSLLTGLPNTPNTGVGYASYLLGEVTSASMQTPKSNKYSARSFSFYAQDEWRLTPKLTLSYGLRYEISQPFSEKFDRIGTFDPAIANPLAGGRLGAITFWGQGPGRNGRHNAFDTYWKAFGPRLGIAYALNSKTVLRAYYGILSAPILGDFVAGGLIDAYGWVSNVNTATQDGGVTSAFNWNNGFPQSIVPQLPNLNPSQLNGSGLSYLNPRDNRPPRSQNLGFALEREIPGGIMVKGEYVGKWIHGLLTQGTAYSQQLNELPANRLSLGSLLTANINSPAAQAAGIAIPYPGFNGSVAQALRPYPQYQAINSPGTRHQFSLYNGFLFTAQKRFSSGLAFLVGYTASKQFELGTVQHLSLLDTGKTLMAFDRPQSLAISYSYELPFGPGKVFLNSTNSFVRHLVGDWKIAGSHNYYAGVPVAVSTRQTLPGISGVWANRVESVAVRTGVGCGDYEPMNAANPFLNVNAFSTPAPFTFGNTRTLPDVRDCPYFNENLAVLKNFPVRESVSIRFGAEFFNVFNRHAWGGLTTDVNNPARFGHFSTATDPRTIQFHLKVSF